MYFSSAYILTRYLSNHSIILLVAGSIAEFVMVLQFSRSQLLNCYIWRTPLDRHALNFYHSFSMIPKIGLYIGYPILYNVYNLARCISVLEETFFDIFIPDLIYCPI